MKSENYMKMPKSCFLVSFRYKMGRDTNNRTTGCLGGGLGKDKKTGYILWNEVLGAENQVAL